MSEAPASDPTDGEAPPVTEAAPAASTTGPKSDPTDGETPPDTDASTPVETEPVSNVESTEAPPVTETAPAASTSGPASDPGGDPAATGPVGESELPPSPGSTTGSY